jgi:hypothetical protein
MPDRNGFHDLKLLISTYQKNHYRAKRQALIMIGALPWPNAAINASAKQRLKLLQSDGKPNNTIGSRN